MNKGTARASIILSMVIFGTIGLARTAVPFSSAMVAFFRGAIAALVLLAVNLIRRKKFDTKALRENMVKLIVSGAMIGFNWVLLFEAYRYTTVSIATVCYYMAPVFIMIASPLTLHEPINKKKAVCIILAMIGIVLVSGVFGSQTERTRDNLIGVLLGLSAALLYACVVNINKKIVNLGGIDRTIFQMGPAALAVLPYWLLTDNIGTLSFDARSLILLAVIAVVNTALAYSLYFAGISHVPAQTAALLSYIDPAVAIILSAVFLGERMSVLSAIGVVLVLGSAIAGEYDFKKRRK